MRGVVVTVGAVLALTAPALGAEPQPYGTNDAGGFRNVLPAGQEGVANALDLARFQASGARPPHWDDQEPLYDGLLYASPNMKAEDVATYFKDATFGVKDGEVASVDTPRPGVTIIRDSAYGVPRIYGDTREDVMFGAGYAGAQDRLFLMDVLRNTGRAQLSSFVGGSRGNREMDRTQWAIAPYTEADLQKQIDNAPKIYGEAGRQIAELGNEFVAGINAYVSEALLDPTKMPAEYAAFGKTPTPWTLTDVIAEASLIGGIFGKGGGNEVRSALILRALEKRFGPRRGRRAWLDFRSKNDPGAPTTVLGRRFPYQTTSAFAKRGLALPDPGSVKFEEVGPPLEEESSASSASIGSQLRRQLAAPAHASNWLLVPGRSSKSGRPLAVMGPQVGYYVPQILLEQEMHGPGFDARGATFPGVNLMVQLGRGRDYAWSATTATSDNVDTFAEVLCEDDFHYMYKGECRPMEKLERTNSWQPTPGDTTPAGSETLTVYRTVHGIVYARGTVNGKKVAFAQARSTYFHEADSALGFFCLNDPACTKDAQSFRKAADGINFAFNWAYVDSKDIAYQLSGAYPQRAKGTSPDFPILGTGEYDWVGFDPELYTMKTVPLDRRPNAVNQRYLISWNNKQAPGWAAADDIYTYGTVHRSEMLERMVRMRLAKGRKMELHELVQAMEEPASQDLRALHVLPAVRRAIGRPRDPRLREALTLLETWRKGGAHRRDLDKDGSYDDDAAVTLMDAWWPKLARAVLERSLGEEASEALQTLAPVGDERTGPAAPDYFGAWYGYVEKDLRTLFASKRARKRIKGRWSRIYCGRGSRKRCRADLTASLAAALELTKADLYRFGDCQDDPDAECMDRNRYVVASAIDAPPLLFQNRPTFQQTVEIPKALPR